MIHRLILICFIIFSGSLHAAEVIREFDSPEQERRYQVLIDELRCLVCQNQNLADSNADLAQDLRNRTYKMIRQGRSDDEILDYMVARYGDFVLYKPPVKAATLLLWYGPIVILLAALFMFWRSSRRKSDVSLAALSDSQRRKVKQQLLDD